MVSASSAATGETPSNQPPLQRLGAELGGYLYVRTQQLLDRAEDRLGEIEAAPAGPGDDSPAAAAAGTGIDALTAGRSLPGAALRSAGAAAAARVRAMLGPDVGGARKVLNVVALVLAGLLVLVMLVLAALLLGLGVLVYLLVRA